MEKKRIVAGWVYLDGKVLVLQRADTRRYYPGKWEPISGEIDPGESPTEAMVREAKEETGCSVTITKSAPEYEIEGEGVIWKVTPFLLVTSDESIKLSEEHKDFQWIVPQDIASLQTVDGAKEDLQRLGLL